MRRHILIILMSALCAIGATAAALQDETLNYKVEYKWGLVNKTAGSLRVRLYDKDTKFASVLTASTAKWADRFYRVRDTLSCEVIKEGFRPTVYKINSHEGDDHKAEMVKYAYSGSKVTGTCTRKKWSDGKLTRDDKTELEAEGTTVDMLSAFYYMRMLPYSTWQKGHVVTINIFSGKKKELLKIKYLGRETIEYDKKKHDCYHISFTFTSNGKKKTSDDIEAWIETTGQCIPVKLEGKLPIGKIRCFYTGS